MDFLLIAFDHHAGKCAFFSSPNSTSMTLCVAPATFKYSISRHKIAYFKSVFIADLN